MVAAGSGVFDPARGAACRERSGGNRLYTALHGQSRAQGRVIVIAVILRARVRAAAAESAARAQRLRALATERDGCLDVVSTSGDGEELGVSFWPDLEHVARWRGNPEHRAARARSLAWYRDDSVDVVGLIRRRAGSGSRG